MPKLSSTKSVSNTKSRRGRSKTKPTNDEELSILDRIVPVTNMDVGGVKMGIYGEPGTGKTRTLGALSRISEGRMLHLVCSSNKTNEARSIMTYDHVDVAEIRDPDDLSQAVQHAKESGKWDSIGLDHLTNFGNLVLCAITGMEKMPEQSSWGLAQQDDYAQMASQTKEYLRELLDFPGNVFILGQERTYEPDIDYDEEFSIAPTVSIATSPSIAKWVAPACDFFIRTFKRQERITVEKTKRIKGKRKVVKSTELTGKVEYCLMCGPDPVYITKFRVPPGSEVPGVVAVGEQEDNDAYAKLKQYLV